MTSAASKRCLLHGITVLLCLLPPHTLAQVEPCDPKDALTRGPLAFTDLTGSDIQCTAEEDRNGTRWRRFHLTATGGVFVYTANREVVRGDIKALDLRAART